MVVETCLKMSDVINGHPPMKNTLKHNHIGLLSIMSPGGDLK